MSKVELPINQIKPYSKDYAERQNVTKKNKNVTVDWIVDSD